MPQPKKQDQSQETTTAEETAVVTMEPGQPNPYLAGLLKQGQDAEEAIKGWYATRANLREQARGVVKTNLCSPEQAEAVEKLWPTPKRGEKAEEAPAAAAAS